MQGHIISEIFGRVTPDFQYPRCGSIGCRAVKTARMKAK